MDVKVHVPEHLEGRLLREASRQHQSPTTFIEALIESQLESPAAARRTFSPQFRALAGSWEDDRTPEQILRDIRDARISKSVPELH